MVVHCPPRVITSNNLPKQGIFYTNAVILFYKALLSTKNIMLFPIVNFINAIYAISTNDARMSTYLLVITVDISANNNVNFFQSESLLYSPQDGLPQITNWRGGEIQITSLD